MAGAPVNPGLGSRPREGGMQTQAARRAKNTKLFKKKALKLSKTILERLFWLHVRLAPPAR